MSVPIITSNICVSEHASPNEDRRRTADLLAHPKRPLSSERRVTRLRQQHTRRASNGRGSDPTCAKMRSTYSLCTESFAHLTRRLSAPGEMLRLHVPSATDAP